MLIVFVSFLVFIGVRELGALALEYLLLAALPGYGSISLIYQLGSYLITCLLALPAFLALHSMLSFRKIRPLFARKDNPAPPVLLSVSLFIVTILPVAAAFLLGVPSSPPDLFTAIWMVLLTPLLEEIVFRGVLLNKLKQYGAIPAVLITAVLFSVGHLYLPNILVSLLPGVFLALIALKTGSIRYTVPLHMLVNLFGGVLLPLLYCLTG